MDEIFIDLTEHVKAQMNDVTYTAPPVVNGFAYMPRTVAHAGGGGGGTAGASADMDAPRFANAAPQARSGREAECSAMSAALYNGSSTLQCREQTPDGEGQNAHQGLSRLVPCVFLICSRAD